MKNEEIELSALRTETDFMKYIMILKGLTNRYCIMVASADTPCGPFFTKEIARMYMDIGFEVDLHNKFRCSYAGILDSGKVIFEEVSATEKVQKSIKLGNYEVEVVSIGFNAPHAIDGIVRINGKRYSVGGRGLSFVVYDKENNNIVDTVRFDTYSQNFVCYRPSQIKEGLEKYISEHPDVTLLGFSWPAFPTSNLTANEKFILKHAVSRGLILENLDKPVFAINKYYNTDDIVEVLNAPKSYHDIHGVRRFEDTYGKRVNIRGGHRVTVNQPENYKRTIYLVGGCNVFGVGAADEHTIASFLQDLLNDIFPELRICVQNYGFYLAELQDARSNEELKILNTLPVKKGDIILWGLGSVPGMPCIDASKIFQKDREFEIFIDNMHYTPHGYVSIAQKLFEGLMELNLLNNMDNYNISSEKETYGFKGEELHELEDYKKQLTDFYNEMFSITIGSIVMNCNPFTLGHRYLIEQALKECDYLAIFVVQEDKSNFSFEDRLRLVSEGVADLPNVMVIPSGRFIISSLTFSEYFNKSELQEREIDTSNDIIIFAKEIAPCLHITKRFVGEEPLDKVTKQYNESMKKILPEYGIQYIEIPRIKSDDEVISASRVRRLLEQSDFLAIKKLVPESTFKYLTEQYDS